MSQISTLVRELGDRECEVSGRSHNTDRVWKVVTALETLAKTAVEKHVH